MNPIGLVDLWEKRARRKWYDAKHEKNAMGKRLIEHGAECYQNCARELREVLSSLLPSSSTSQGECQKKRRHLV